MTLSSSTSKPYSVFLSYNGDDRELVQSIAVYLADEARLNPWFDQWSLIPGEPWVRMLERGLESSSSCAVFIGEGGHGPWQLDEIEAALRQHNSDEGFRVIPVLLPNAPPEIKLPSFLYGNTLVDFRKGLDDDLSRWRLECGIRGIPPGQGRPLQKETVAIPALPIPVELEDLNITRASRSANVFISYRHHEPDSTLAHMFAGALRRAGHHPFIDTGLRWGSDWVKAIRNALEKADFLLLLLSRESGMSEMVVKEVHLAKELAEQHKGRPVILPVRLRLPFMEPLPYQLAIGLHHIHQESWDDDEDSARIVDRLLATVANRSDWEDDQQTEIETMGQVAELQPQFDPRSMTTPGGSLRTDSRFYIIREADSDVFSELQKPRAVVTVHGPRQSGKTSLMMGMYVALRHADVSLRTAFIDCQALEDSSLKSRNAIWFAIATQISKQLKTTAFSAADWDFAGGYVGNASAFLDKFVFADDQRPLLICLDEVDRLFSARLGSKFFSSVRAFYNSGAHDPTWANVRWLLGTSSEPRFFIKDLNQSPFNIGFGAELSTFNLAEIKSFAGRHGLSLDQNTLREVWEFVGGRPYLVHLMFYNLVRKPLARSDLFSTAFNSRGIFRDHLHSYLVHFQREKPLASAMKSIISGKGCKNEASIERLEAAGLVRRDETRKPVPACRLYAEFFGA